MAAIPYFAPGMVLWSALAILASPSVSRFLRTSRPHASLLILALGLVLMATLPPTVGALGGTGSYRDTCDLTRITLAPLPVLLRLNDTSLNVALFVPLGIALGLLSWSTRTFLVIATAFLLPLAIELFQLAFPDLGRKCESADVIDNALGLAIGLTIAFVVRWLLGRARYSRTRT